ncbi:MAG TPA: MBL fold metallo-hydrolase [Candidatus Acidoferrales bacterium]|nr:MBL fold metallo-hydrolase [Candidatus Acidoferrales bacterium]
MILERFEVPGLSHYSYMVASCGCAAVFDPKRDIDTYLAYAAQHDWTITHVFETHIHADYASGARELAEVTGAALCLSAHDQGEDYVYGFPHRAVADGDRIELQDAAIVALHTPGHTPEHLSFLLYESARCPEPLMLFSGDFLFVGSLGRPDLLGEGAKRRLAELLHDSLHRKIRHLPDGVAVYPAHGAGSFCGSGISERSQSTLGYERASNSFFADRDRETFVGHILSTVPPFPDYYRRMKRLNSQGPPPLAELPEPAPLGPAQFLECIERDGAIVVDLRRPEPFGGSHVPGSLNIGLGPSFVVWAAWVVPCDHPILLVGDEATDLNQARRSLVQVGLDNVRGYLKGGIRAWLDSGLELDRIEQISAVELAHRRGHGAEIIDVRSDGEWAAGHIEGALHIPGGDLPKRLAELPHDATLHLICATGYRSGIAASLLRRAGFRRVVNVAGGMNAWRERGLPAAAGA